MDFVYNYTYVLASEAVIHTALPGRHTTYTLANIMARFTDMRAAYVDKRSKDWITRSV